MKLFILGLFISGIANAQITFESSLNDNGDFSTTTTNTFGGLSLRTTVTHKPDGGIEFERGTTTTFPYSEYRRQELYEGIDSDY